MEKALYKGLSDKVLGCLFKVHNVLGPGLLESAYEAACVIEFRHEGIEVEQQAVYPLFYRGEMAGAYIADLVVEDKLAEIRVFRKAFIKLPLIVQFV